MICKGTHYSGEQNKKQTSSVWFFNRCFAAVFNKCDFAVKNYLSDVTQEFIGKHDLL